MILNLCEDISKDVFVEFCSVVKMCGSKIGVTSGCYDLFHTGHLSYLERCYRYLGGEKPILIVGVDSDCLVKKNKGFDRPIFNENQRVKIIDGCKYVSFAFIMNNIEDHKLIVDLAKPHYVFKNQSVDRKEVWCGTGEFVLIPDIDEIISTTEFIKKIKGTFSSSQSMINSVVKSVLNDPLAEFIDSYKEL